MKPLRRKNLHYDWHWDWDYGNGELGNWGIHLLDGAAFALGVRSTPNRVLSVGGRFGYEDDGQTPNTQIIVWDTSPIPIGYEMRGLPRNRALQKDGVWTSKEMDKFHRRDYGVSVVCEGGCSFDNVVYDKEGKVVQEFTDPVPSYYQNFFDAVRAHDRQTSYAIDSVVPCANLIHLGNISHQTGKPATVEEIGRTVADRPPLQFLWERMLSHLDANGVDMAKTPPILGSSLSFDSEKELFVGDGAEDANRYLCPAGRKEFRLPDRF